MKKKVANMIIVLLIIFIVIFLSFKISNSSRQNKTKNEIPSSNEISIETLALDIKVINENQENIVLNKELENQKEFDNYFVLFFSPNCKPCVNEVKMLNKLVSENVLKRDPILIGIGKYEEIKQLIDDNDITLNYYSIDLEEFKEKVKVNAVPLNLVFDESGNILFSKTGWSNDKKAVDIFTQKINSYN